MKAFKILLLSSMFFTLSGCSLNDFLDRGGSQEGASGVVTDDCGTMNREACDMFHRVNDYRLSHGKQALVFNQRCTSLAQDHAVDMVARDYFSHNSPTETFQQRVARYGLGYYVGENIAMGSAQVETIFMMWKNSSGHNTNMLNSQFRSSGLGYYQGYWVQCFSGEDL